MARKYNPERNRDEALRKRLIAKHGKRCMQCGYEGYVDLHHKVRIVDGGRSIEENAMLLCEKCHADAHGLTKRKYLDANREHWNGHHG